MGFGIFEMSKSPPGVDFVLPGGVFELLAAMTDVEKAAADNAKARTKNTFLTCFIISPVK